MKPNRRALVVSIVIAVFLLSRLAASPVLAQIRAVDLLTIFAAGMACGVAIVSAFVRGRSGSESPAD